MFQSSLSLAGSTDATTKDAARTLAQNGAAAYESGEYEKALEFFRRAYALVPAPTISIYEARCLSRLGLLIEATSRYEETKRAPVPADASPAFRKAQQDAEHELADVEQRTPRVRIKVDGTSSESADLHVTLDGRLIQPDLVGVPMPVNPGLHRVAASVPGVASGRATVLAQEGQFHLVSVPLEPSADGQVSRDSAPQKPSDTKKTVGIVMLGVGAIGVAVGATSAIIANGKRHDLDDACTADGQCPKSSEGDLSSYHTARTLSFVGYGVGAVGLATGAVLLFWPKKEAAKARVMPYVGLGSVGATGKF